MLLVFPAKGLINPVLSVPVDPAVAVGMLPELKGEELPEKVQRVVLLVSLWRGLMVRINCAWLRSKGAKGNKQAVAKAVSRTDLLPMRDA